MAWYRCRHKSSGGGITPVGDAVVGDVLIGKTFTNATDIGLVGTMPNNGAVSQVLDTTTQSYTVPQGYHDGTGTVSINTQTKSVAPSTAAQTITPDSGKVLSSVSVAAMSPIHTGGTAWVTLSGINATAPWVYIPGGWYPQEHATYGTYVYMTAAQAKELHRHTETYTPTSRSAALDMGEKHAYRYVNTNSVPNTNSGTYTYPASGGETVDLGAANTYRYVNAQNVYSTGYTNGYNAAGGDVKHTVYVYAKASSSGDNDWLSEAYINVDGVRVANFNGNKTGSATIIV